MPGIEENRESFRREIVPRMYSGRLHLILTITLLSGLLIFSCFQLREFRRADLIWFAVLFFIMDLNSYFVHKYSMHRKGRFFSKGHWFHTVKHHGLFVPGQMGIDRRDDFYMILFPPTLILGIALGLIPSYGFLLNLVAGERMGWIYAIAAYSYYLFYELIHLSAHTKDTSVLRKIPVLRSLVAHHTRHHDPQCFDKNLGIVTPFTDYLFKSKK